MDSRLVLRAQHGDREAFTSLVDGIGGRLHAIAFSVLRDRDLAHDATQQTLLTAWQDLPRLRDPERFEAWACRILVRNCRHESRRAKRWIPASSSGRDRELVAPDEMGLVGDRDQLEHGFRRLNVDQRTVLVLTFYYDLTPTQASEILGVPVGTVNSRLHRALQSMHAALDADARLAKPAQGPANAEQGIQQETQS